MQITPKRFENTKWQDVPLNIKELINNITENRKGIYIWGQSGSGKTHIAYAIANYLPNRDKNRIKVIVKNVPELLKSIRDDYNRQNQDKEWTMDKIIENRDLLILDDIGSEKITDWVEETFYLLINKKYEEMIPIIFTSNYSIEELSTRLSDRIISRIVGSCDIINLKGNDRRIGK